MCVYLCVCVHVCLYLCVETRGQPLVSSTANLDVFELGSSPSGLEFTNSAKPAATPRDPCFHLTNAAIISVPRYVQLLNVASGNQTLVFTLSRQEQSCPVHRGSTHSHQCRAATLALRKQSLCKLKFPKVPTQEELTLTPG